MPNPNSTLRSAPQSNRGVVFAVSVVAILAGSGYLFNQTLTRRKEQQHQHARRKEYPNPI
ncbi:hypothetical protein BMF94_5942 [Rhodotorula taiwanensis]|uniref:Uncharacterized protein n=1 Tax=Rhodotorula taiwanensis TaxID=741276 RepID=A0A2S5B2L2_9BASI|nr:hypothetical protein BMF94_5942 [Rhodotorula taiwanensis]